MSKLVQKSEVVISIIMPVYNVGSILRKTLDSIRAQEFSYYEVLMIDDGSTDGSGIICDEYVSMDQRFQVYHRENQGAALSRNFGLEHAIGKYVIFLDSDDYFFPNMLSVAYQRIEKDKAEMVVFGSEWVTLSGQNEEVIVSSKNEISPNYILRGITNKNDFMVINHVPWNKLIDLKWLLKSNIRFQNIPANNDVFFSMAAGLCAKRISVCEKSLLRYYHGRNGSLTQERMKTKLWLPKAFDELIRIYWKTLSLEKKQILCYFMTESLISIFTSSDYSLNCKCQTEQLLQECENLLTSLSEMQGKGLLKPYAQVLINKFEQKELANLQEFDLYLPTLKDILEKNKECKIALWGCGKIGLIVLQGMECSGLHIDYLIDQDEQKQGKILYGYQIQSFGSIQDKVDLIIVTGVGISNVIHRIVGETLCIDLHKEIFDC